MVLDMFLKMNLIVGNVNFGMNLYLSNQVLIKLDQLKLLIAVRQLVFSCFWPLCHISHNTC
jgi:hypothetical protein